MDPLTTALLQALAAEPEGAAVSLPRLGKQLGQSASVLMRQLAQMGEQMGEGGPGWVRVAMEEGRAVARLTPAGRAAARAIGDS